MEVGYEAVESEDLSPPNWNSVLPEDEDEDEDVHLPQVLAQLVAIQLLQEEPVQCPFHLAGLRISLNE